VSAPYDTILRTVHDHGIHAWVARKAVEQSLMPAFIDFPDYAGHSPAFNGALNRPRSIPLV
jgi:hypothetical protein